MVFIWSCDRMEGVDCKRRWACSTSAFVLCTKVTKPPTTFPCEFESSIPIRGRALERILTYLEHHRDRPMVHNFPKPVTNHDNMRNLCKKDLWDADFADLLYLQRRQLFYDVLLMGYHLGITGLVPLLSARLAMTTRGVPLSQLKQILNAAGSGHDSVCWDFDVDQHRIAHPGTKLPRDCAALPPFDAATPTTPA